MNPRVRGSNPRLDRRAARSSALGAWYTFLDRGGGSLHDSSGYKRHGSISGSSGAAGFETVNHELLCAYHFNGSNDEVDCGSGLDPSGLSRITMEGWAKSDTGGTNEVLCGWWDGADGCLVHSKSVGEGGEGLFVLAGGGVDLAEFLCDTTSDFFHFALVYDGSLSGNANRLKLYYQGDLAAAAFHASASIPATLGTITSNLGIGDAGPLARHWDGHIATVRVYPGVALTAAEIERRFRDPTSEFLHVRPRVFRVRAPAGTTIEASLSLGLGLGVATGSIAEVEAGLSLDASLGMSPSGEAELESALSLSQSLGIAQGAEATFEAGLLLTQSFALTAVSELISGSTIEAALTLAQSHGMSASAQADLEAGLSLMQALGFALGAQAVFESTASFDLALALQQDPVAILEASAALGQSLGLAAAGGSAVSAELALTISQGMSAASEITLEGALEIGVGLGVGTGAQADLQAETVLEAQLGLALIADAILEAGLSLDQVHNLTVTSTKIIAGLTTPDGRTRTVSVSVRSRTTSAAGRTRTIQ